MAKDAKKPQLSKECDTVVRYRGKGRIPYQAGSSTVVFSLKRPVHMVPKWLADELSNEEDFEITKEQVPTYKFSESKDEPFFDAGSAEGQVKLREAFATDPIGSLKKIKTHYEGIINTQEEMIESLHLEISELTGEEPAATKTPNPETLDIPDNVKELLTHESLSAWLDAREVTNKNEIGAVTKRLTTLLASPNQKSHDEYSEYIEKLTEKYQVSGNDSVEEA